jgi:hypothetical protein
MPASLDQGRGALHSPLDLMVDNIDAWHGGMSARELHPSAIEGGDIHNSFTVTDPDGDRVVVNNSHAVGPV